MSIDLFKLVQEHLSDDLLNKASSFLGESKETTKSGFSAAIPALMAGLISKGSDTNGAKDLFQLISKPALSGNLLNNLGGLFSGTGDSASGDIGGSILNTVFGDKMGGIVNIVSGAAGLKSGSGSSLLKMAAPLLMSVIGKQVSGSGQGIGSFIDLIMGQKENLKKYAPAGLLDALGGSLNLGSLAAVATNFAKGSTTVAGRAGDQLQASGQQGGGMLKKLLPFLLLGAVALLAFYFMRGCNNGAAVADTAKEMVDSTAQSVDSMVTDASAAVTDAAQSIYNVGENLIGKTVAGFESLGAFTKRKLNSGTELIIPENGVESKLIKFVESADPVSKDLWFDFDRILFETGSASLKAESAGQITNIAEILKAFPKVHLKIGGYTDNVGNPASNLNLSKARAESVVSSIVSQGVEASRLSSEGYGDKYPVTTNDTEEGRAKNRRVSARVTQK